MPLLLLQSADSVAAAAEGLTAAQQLWAYVGLGATAFPTSEATPLLGGLAAYEGRLALLPVIGAIVVGTTIAHLLLYWLGRTHGDAVRARLPRLRSFLLRAFAIVRRHPWRASLLVRFAFGLRIALPIACGAARVPLALFAIGSTISALAWATTFTLVGWAVGGAALRFLGEVRRYDQWIALGIVAAVFVAWLVMRRKPDLREERVERAIRGRKDRG